MDSKHEILLYPGEPAAVSVLGAPNDAPFLIVCDHAGNRLPRRLGTLGLSEADRLRHIAWDIGAAGVARGLATRLGAFAILQAYSRLAIDCNRPLHVASLIATVSEHTDIPGNRSITNADRERRIDAIFRPYHDRIATELDRRQAGRIPTALIAVHSFTPVYKGHVRPWQVGLLYNRDDRLGKPLMALLRAEGGLTVGDNEPYAVSDESDYTIPVHAEQRGLPYAEIEIRQDLIADAAGQLRWAELMARLLRSAWRSLQS
jgi:predicted N-formylglutamate amidohydrolase